MDRLDPAHAQILLQVYELRREEKLRHAREWLMGSFWAENLEEFEMVCPPGTPENAFYRMVTGYWDMVASIVNRGMLDEDLYFENNLEALLTWLRVRNVTLQMREARKNPLILRNLESLSARHEQWLETRAPGALAVTRKRLAAMRQKPEPLER
jgi:hypothetical protein